VVDVLVSAGGMVRGAGAYNPRAYAVWVGFYYLDGFRLPANFFYIALFLSYFKCSINL
jgi:hypothetical protein